MWQEGGRVLHQTQPRASNLNVTTPSSLLLVRQHKHRPWWLLVITFIHAGTSLFVAVAATFTLFQEDLQDLLFYGSLSIGTASLGVGDIAGALLWSTALWFVSPLQLLLLFLGRIETERPSDWLLQVLGRAAGMQYVPQRCTLPCSSHSITYRQDDPEYEAPLPLRAAVGGITLATGTALAVLLSGGLGDATWSVSTGLGACMAAGMYEVGRPTRMSKEQAVALELQWQDFASFAEQQLQRSGRCHETEVFRVFRRALPKYRDIEVLDDAVLRQMIKNWHPGVERTALGYYKGLSLSPPREA